MRKLVIAIALGWLILLLFRFESLYILENMISDKLATQTSAVDVDPRIKIISIDDESLEKVGSWPWPRDIMADLIDTVASNGATAVSSYVLFTQQSVDPNEDKALAEVIAKHDHVYLAVYFDFEALTKPKQELEQNYLILPIVNIPQDRIGHINFLPDKDGVVRKALPGIPTLEEEVVPSLDIRLLNVLLPEQQKITWNNNYFWFRGEEEMVVDKTLQLGLSYSTSPEDPKFDIIPAWQVIEGEIDSTYFKDSIVMIGHYSEQQQDLFSTPFGKQMNSLEIHANIIQAGLDDKFYTELEESRGGLITLLLVLIAFVLFVSIKTGLGAIILIISIAIYSAIVYYLFNSYGMLYPYFYAILALLLAFGGASMEKHLTKRKERIEG